MASENFFIVLPSNSSMKYFPDNATTNFTTQLPREISLHGQWVVGLTEIHIPYTITHLQREDCNIFWHPCGDNGEESRSRQLCDKIPHGIYQSHGQLMWELNNIPRLKKRGVRFIESREANGHVSVEISTTAECKDKAEPEAIILPNKIGRILGFDAPPTIDEGSSTTRTVYRIPTGVASVGVRPACINRALPDQLFVYTDICVPYTVGDVQAALLRIVNLDTARYTYGSTGVKYFSPANYLSLMNNRFRVVSIDIRDHLGVPISFEYGTLTVTLHFKRIG